MIPSGGWKDLPTGLRGKSKSNLIDLVAQWELHYSGGNLRRMKDQEGNYVSIEKKIHYSNVNLIDPLTNRATRVALKYTDDGGLIRVSKKSGQVIHWPEKKTPREKPILEG